MKTYLVTGGLGFIGSHLSRELSKNNKVIIIDDMSTGKASNIKKNNNITIVNQKVQNSEYEKKIDGIFHLAAQPSVPLSISHTYESTSNNILSSLKVFETARLKKIPVLYASSSAIYGNIPKGSDLKKI